MTNLDFSATPNLGTKLRIQSLLPSLVADITQKTPLDGVRGATRAARPAGAHGPLTAWLATHFSFCSTPRESVTAPAQSITMQIKGQRPVRDAIRPARNVKVRMYLSFCMCEWKGTKFSFLLIPSFFPPSLVVPLACQPHNQPSPASAPSVCSPCLQLPSDLGCSAASSESPILQDPDTGIVSSRKCFTPSLSSFSTCRARNLLPGKT